MASQEHLQQLNDDDTASSASSSSDDNDGGAADDETDIDDTEDSAPPPPPPPPPPQYPPRLEPSRPLSAPAPASSTAVVHPKMRLKLSFKMPKTPDEGDPTTPNLAPSAEMVQFQAPDSISKEGGKKNSESNSSASSIPKSSSKASSIVPSSPVSLMPVASPMKKARKDVEAEPDPVKVEVEHISSSSVLDEEGPLVEAQVVKSNSDVNDDDVNAVIAEPVVSAIPSKSGPGNSSRNPTSSSTTGAATKPRRTATKPVRLPALSSPGMLLASPSVFPRMSMEPNTGGGDPNKTSNKTNEKYNGYSTPASVFDHNMTVAGYTRKLREENAHRGSTVQRHVGDMFDSDVKLFLPFPTIVTDLWAPRREADHEMSEEEKEPTNVDLEESKLVTILKRGLTTNPPNGDRKGRKRARPKSLSEMAPVSLSIGYPDAYVKKYEGYVKAVEAREEAILQSHLNTIDVEEGSASPRTIEIPPIPEPPEPPRLSELTDRDKYDSDEVHHPNYLPKGKESFVAHLDKNAFNISSGRYFGLYTNFLADPHFVGSCAPGIAGITVSAGTSLATAYIGHTSAGSASLASTVYGNSSNSSGSGSNNAGNSGKEELSSGKSASSKASGIKKASSPAAAGGNKKKTTPSSSSSAATSSAADLRKVMEGGGEAAVRMKQSIMRAAVFASRTGNHGQAFVGSNGRTYPDVSKAFAAHAGLKPCDRCKNNKQGAYHCRLRRKHKDFDYDGGSSTTVLLPLFEGPLEELLNVPQKVS